MKINVPEWAINHFWEEPPEGHCEFWAFRFEPKCKVGDVILFYINKKFVAQAIVALIEPPGKSECESTGRFKNRWKVYWRPETFIDLRENPER